MFSRRVLGLGASVALLGVVASHRVFAEPPSVDSKTAIQVEALKRLKDVDLDSNTAVKGALEGYNEERLKSFEGGDFGQDVLTFWEEFKQQDPTVATEIYLADGYRDAEALAPMLREWARGGK